MAIKGEAHQFLAFSCDGLILVDGHKAQMVLDLPEFGLVQSESKAEALAPVRAPGELANRRVVLD